MQEVNRLTTLSYFILGAIFLLSVFAIVQTVFGAGGTVNVSSLVTVGNSAPTVSNVVVNGGNLITLTANATTSVTVSFTVTDANGCNDVFSSGNITSTIFRSGVGASCTASNLNCYTVSTTTNNCTANASTSLATTTFGIYYFAESTNGGSSTFPTEDWGGSVTVRDASAASSTATSTSNQELDVLTALEVTTSSINYGTVSANANTGATNQVATSSNAGNSSTTLRLHAVATLTSGSNSISTSSQVYSTSSFTYAGTSTALTDTAVTVWGFFITAPTSTTSSNYSRATFWGLAVPPSTPTGSYSGTTRFTALWQP